MARDGAGTRHALPRRPAARAPRRRRRTDHRPVVVTVPDGQDSPSRRPVLRPRRRRLRTGGLLQHGRRQRLAHLRRPILHGGPQGQAGRARRFRRGAARRRHRGERFRRPGVPRPLGRGRARAGRGHTRLHEEVRLPESPPRPFGRHRLGHRRRARREGHRAGEPDLHHAALALLVGRIDRRQRRAGPSARLPPRDRAHRGTVRQLPLDARAPLRRHALRTDRGEPPGAGFAATS